MKPRKLLSTLCVAAALCMSVSAHAQSAQTFKKGVNTMSHEKKQEVPQKTSADEASSFGEYKAIVDALQPYIDGAKTGDGNHLRSAFYDHAHIVGSMDGKYLNPDADAFKEAINGAGKSPKVEHHIAWINISGPAAAAKLEFINWLGFRFTDFLVLYKKDGTWKISGKVYDSHSRN